ncbi:hypothetical protein [Candidatus Nanosyncoccus nanoralicus]|uniref:Poly A polymerase head domain-containing protein n=1 Tax=Candidatus Nanosyncoccus nanoralicus TaxID=2171996 RepID=A0ABY0FKR9_9BACT|nr:hypothetical protein [Candidatus Nanosyncoccus nanoralicus]RYC74034.1 hypothetical protein G3KMM_00080 [Candidatus Nanosyncoccus nanoralicus]
MAEQLNQFYSVENQDSQVVNGEASLSTFYQPELQQQFSDPELDLLLTLSSSLQRQIGIKMEDFNLDATEQDDSPEDEYDDNDGFEEEENYENEYDDEDERIEFRDSYKKINQYPLTPEIYERFPFLHELPQGVAVMGGVARSITRQFLTGDIEPIRDIDLVHINDREGDQPVSPEELEHLSQKFMPEDYAFGHGIQPESFEHYFRTRDFTVNESLILNNQLYFTESAKNDFLENIIRPTYKELPNYQDELSSRLFLKALMMQSVIAEFTDSIPTLEDINYVDRIRTFDIALMLNKCISRGAEVAQSFTANLVDWDVISEDFLGRPLAAARDLRQDLYNFNYYPSAYKPNQDSSSNEKSDREIKEYLKSINFKEFDLPDSMSRFHTSDPSIRLAIKEYEEGSTDQIRLPIDKVPIDPDDYPERFHGQYEDYDFDFINSED